MSYLEAAFETHSSHFWDFQQFLSISCFGPCLCTSCSHISTYSTQQHEHSRTGPDLKKAIRALTVLYSDQFKQVCVWAFQRYLICAEVMNSPLYSYNSIPFLLLHDSESRKRNSPIPGKHVISFDNIALKSPGTQKYPLLSYRKMCFVKGLTGINLTDIWTLG